jgi:hypothetical protein
MMTVMQKTAQFSKLSAILLLGTVCTSLALGSYTLVLKAQLKRSQQEKTSVLTPFSPRISPLDMPEWHRAISKSSQEWFDEIVKEVPATHLQRMVVTTTVQGKVLESKQESGAVGHYQYYYVGEPGSYAYQAMVKLDVVNGPSQVVNYRFSPRRVEVMKVVVQKAGRTTPARFADIKPGDVLQIAETVDLAQDNIDDKNVLELVLTIVRE